MTDDLFHFEPLNRKKPVKKGVARTVQVGTWVTPRDAARLEKIAHRHGMSVSNFLRELIDIARKP